MTDLPTSPELAATSTVTDPQAAAPDGRPTQLVRCADASLTFGSGAAAVVAVHGTTFVVSPRARIAIAGPSGSGKSSLLHLIAGLEQPTSGSITWPALSPTAAGRSHDIGVVFQGPSLIPTLTVTENVALPLVLAGASDADGAAHARECLARVSAAEFADKLPEELSGGQAQRAAVARVLAQRPRLILADEPTGQLDHDTGHRVLDALLAAADDLGAALVVTSHDPTITSRLEQRWTMHEGRLVTTTDPIAHDGDNA